MLFSRRQTLGLLGSAVAAPYIRPSSAAEPIEYVRICDAFGPGFYYIPGSDICLRIGLSGNANGFNVSSIREPDSEPRTGTLKSYNLNGDLLESSPLGSQTGPTDGDECSVVGVEMMAAGETCLVVFASEANNAGSGDFDEMYARPYSRQLDPLEDPNQLNGNVDGGYANVCTTRIGQNTAAGYSHYTIDGYRARSSIIDRNGWRVGPERAITGGMFDQDFVSDVVATDQRILWGIMSVENFTSKHWVQRADAEGARIGDPIRIRPPSGLDIHGTPSFLPDAGGGFSAFYWTAVDSNTARLNFQRYENDGTRGPVKALGQQEVDDFAAVGNSPKVCRLADDSILALTASTDQIIAWWISALGALKNRRRFRRRRNRRIRLRNLVRFKQTFATVWDESDQAQTAASQRWGAEVFEIASDMRLKRDIVRVDRLASGLGLYRYRYHWSDTEYVGVMAQEVAEVSPGAVRQGVDGYLRVDYGQLGMRLRTWSSWAASQ